MYQQKTYVKLLQLPSSLFHVHFLEILFITKKVEARGYNIMFFLKIYAKRIEYSK